MLYWTTFKVALSSLLANKFRTFLAMLGIIIGVSAVISMLAIGAGARLKVMEKVSEFGTNFLFLRPQQSEEDGVATEEVKPTLTLEDALAIVGVEGVESVTPMVWNGGNISRRGRNSWASMPGVTAPFFDIRNFAIEAGRAFTDEENDECARLVVIGPDVKNRLFEEHEDPLGKDVWINDINFTVIGLTKRKGDSQWRGADRMVFMPVNTAMKRVFGTETLHEVNIKVVSSDMLYPVIARITTLLRRRNNLRDNQSNNFHLRSQDAVIEMEADVQKTFRILLATIAGISLLVGGIGIMNIMLVTVKERTREIGVRKAIGARDRDILRQFLFEAIFMCGIGGAIGCGLGILASDLIQRYTEYTTIVDPTSVVVSFSVSAAVGIFFGYYPASRAASLNTIDALRYA